MNDEQINEVMRLADELADACAGCDSSHFALSHRKELESYLRTIGEPENTFPINPNGSSKWAHLQKRDGAEAIGVVFRTGSGSVGSLVDGRVVWADWLAHPGAKESPSIHRGFSLVPNYAGIDNAVSALYRRFSDWSKQGFGADDVTWCEVKADVLAIISMSQVENMAKSVNAELLEALKDARHCIGIDRDTLVDCHTNPCTGYLDPDGALAKAEYDDVIDAADAAIARAESAMPFWPDHSSAISDPLFHQARGIMGTENFGQEEALRLAILHVLNARAESAIETPAMASPTTAAPTAPLKPHVFRQLVNDLRDLAKQYYGHDSLRDRISGRLAQDVPVVGPCQGHAAQQERAARLVEPTEDHRREPWHYIGGEEAVEMLDGIADKIRALEVKP